MAKRIGFYEPEFDEEEIKRVTKVLKNGMVSEGKVTKQLEEKLAKIVGTKYVIMTTSCTAAIYLALEADKRIRGYKKGLVAMPSLTMVGTRNAVEVAGLTPICLDVDTDFMLNSKRAISYDVVLKVNLLGRSKKDDPDVRYVVDYLPLDKEDTFEVISSPIIYDNAGCLGSKVNNGLVGCYSLQANKIISTGGQGGFCATNDIEYATMIRKLKDFGREHKEDNDTKGFNLKFNDVQAAIGLGQLKKLGERKKILLSQYNLYRSELYMFGEFMDYREGEIPLWIEFYTKDQIKLKKFLERKNIFARIPWKPIIDFRNADDYYKNVLWLPSGPKLSPRDILKVCKAIKEFYLG